MMHEITCRDCFAKRERIEELEEELRQARDALAGTEVGIDPLAFRALHLTRSEAQVLQMLLAREMLTTEAYMAVRSADDWDGDPKILDVFVCKLRKKLAPRGIQILTVWGKGWYMPADMKAAVRALGGDVDAAAPTRSPQQYSEVQAAVIAALQEAPYGLTWYALRRAANVGDAKLQQALSILMNSRAVRRDFARQGNQFVYSAAQQAAA